MQNPSCYLYGVGDARIEDRPIPALEDPYDVLIRIGFVGVCGSDVHFWTHGGINNKNVSETNPIVMGHEAAGTVHSVGSAVTSLKPGDQVAIEPGYPCRRCKTCKAGKYNFCPKMKFAACPPDAHGALTKFFRTPEDFCYKLPHGVGLDEGVLIEPLAVAVHVTKQADIKPGQSVVIFGSGTIGLVCAAVARAYGAKKVVNVDILQRRLDFAKKYAATHAFLPDSTASSEENAANLIRDCELQDGADVVLECSGAEPSIQTGVHVLKMGGQFVQAGLGRQIINFPIVLMSEKELHVHGSFRYGSGDFELAREFLEMGKVSLKPLISSTVPFEKTTEAWERTRKGEGIKNLIRGVQD